MRRFVILALSAFVLVAAACGDDDDIASVDDIVPDLSDLGLETLESGTDPLAPENARIYRALYRDADNESRSALTVIYIEHDAEAAAAEFAMLSEALRTPPAEFFGGNATQADHPALAVGDEQKAYVTERADSLGNLIWTDIVRAGNVVFITQVLGPANEDATPFRTTLAERIIDGNVE